MTIGARGEDGGREAHKPPKPIRIVVIHEENNKISKQPQKEYILNIWASFLLVHRETVLSHKILFYLFLLGANYFLSALGSKDKGWVTLAFYH